jgi:hypothetical protein
LNAPIEALQGLANAAAEAAAVPSPSTPRYDKQYVYRVMLLPWLWLGWRSENELSQYRATHFLMLSKKLVPFAESLFNKF